MAEYLIKGETLTGIADQVRRISGVEVKMTTAQIITALENNAPGIVDVRIEGVGSIPANAKLYYVGNTQSAFSLNFESSAVGALSE